ISYFSYELVVFIEIRGIHLQHLAVKYFRTVLIIKCKQFFFFVKFSVFFAHNYAPLCGLSKYPCNINTAAILSITAFLFLRDKSASSRDLSAATVLSRSSHRVILTSVSSSASNLAKCCDLSPLSPIVLFIFFGRPTTMVSTSLVFAISTT